MRINFYGKRIPPPTKNTALAFGSEVEPILMKGGQGTVYHAGNIILKPGDESEFNNWICQTFLDLPEPQGFRFTRPIKSVSGWIYNGYAAWSFLEGEHLQGHYKEKITASKKFHKLLQNIEKPDFVGTGEDSWSVADRVALGEKEFNYDKEFQNLYDQIKPYLKSVPSDRQILHGDLYGNFLIDPVLPPAIIDFSTAWGPNGFAESIMLTDAIMMGELKPEELLFFKEVPNIELLAWRGLLRRITEQPEHIRYLGKDKEQAIEEAEAFQKAIDFLKRHF